PTSYTAASIDVVASRNRLVSTVPAESGPSAQVSAVMPPTGTRRIWLPQERTLATPHTHRAHDERAARQPRAAPGSRALARPRPGARHRRQRRRTGVQLPATHGARVP